MLKQQTEETPLPPQHHSVQPATPTSAERFDKQALQEILATAAYLQQAEQDTLSRAEVESIAAEMGLAPQHVRQAIALSGQRTVHRHHLPYTGLSTRQKRLVAATTLVYSVFTCFVAATARDPYSSLTWLIYLVHSVTVYTLPFVIAWLGFKLRFKRAGAAAGGIVTVIAYVLAFVVGLLTDQYNHHLGYPWVWTAVMIVCGIACGGVAAGFGGAALHQWLASRRLRSVPSVVKPSDFDR